MKLKDKHCIVVGLGKSGLATCRFLKERGARVQAFDISKTIEENTLKDLGVEVHLGQNPTGEEEADLVVMSPGIPLDLPFVQAFLKHKVEVTGEVELAYRFAKGSFLGITGTNGKTTTTTLLGDLLSFVSYDTRVVGNIGAPVIEEVQTSGDDTFFVTELSSFQLETVKEFKCRVAGILNVTPDHLNRHGSLENYGNIKANIFMNQEEDDVAVLNFEDGFVRSLGEKCRAKVLWFSVRQRVSPGLYLKDGQIISTLKGEDEVLFARSEVALAGDHNMENVLMAMCMAYSVGVSFDAMRMVLNVFQGVEHRLEFVRELGGIRYINDSKGTNPDASTKAVEAFEGNLILIAGGMDKKVSFDTFVEAFQGKVKTLILLGETKRMIQECAERHGFRDVILVEDMKEAVERAHSIAVEGDLVLLSPACASWDMYPSYEVRGEDFKSRVRELKEK